MAVFDTARDEIFHAAIWQDVGITLLEAALGLFAGTLLGTACGLLLWGNGRAEAVARPYLVCWRIPIFALAPMIIIWFGIGYCRNLSWRVSRCFRRFAAGL